MREKLDSASVFEVSPPVGVFLDGPVFIFYISVQFNLQMVMLHDWPWNDLDSSLKME